MVKEQSEGDQITYSSKFKTGLALSGGSARGYGHIGILKALVESGVEPDIIAGTSMGAVIGVFYAAGYQPEEIHKIMTEESLFKVVGFSWNGEGMLTMNRLKKVLQEHLEDDFGSLKKPFYLNVVNLNEGRTEYRSSGPLFEYLIASCSAPVIFAPKVIKGINYVDGGLLCNLPASCIREKCHTLIGAHVNHPGISPSFSGTKDILERAVNLGITENSKFQMELCDHLFDPPEMQSFSIFDFKKAEELVEVGYQHTMKLIQEGEFH